MAKLTLKEILNQVLSQSAHITKSNFVSSNDVDDQQMVAVANRVVDEILNWYSWGELRKTFTVTAQPNQTRYLLPSDFNALVSDSMRDKDGTRKVEVNVPDKRWFQYKFGTLNSGPTHRVRFYGDEIEFADITPGEEIIMEYWSNQIVRDDTGSTKDRFDSDSDTFILNDQMLILGIQAAWAETKMLPQAGKWEANYYRRMAHEVARTTQGETIGGSQNRFNIGNAPYTPTYVK
jgi:hypothetical protein